MFENYRVKNYNFKLFLVVLSLSVIGTIMIYSADHSYLNKQIAGLCLCIIGMIVLSLIDYKLISKFQFILYIINLLLLLSVLLFGNTVGGAKRWIGNENFVTLQPSEFSKVIMIICAAYYLSSHKETINTFKTLFGYAVLCAIPLALIVSQPDLSTTIDLFIVLLSMLFIAGLSYKIIIVALLCLIPASGLFLWNIKQPHPLFIREYWQTRILTFLYPEDYASTTQYQQDNSVMAIGSGQLFGKGLTNSTLATVKDANLISEQQTDFIFSVIGEELGFVGSVVVIVFLGIVVLQCIKTARKANDEMGMFIATGAATLIGFQTFINIGVATSILPNTGIPLPFISAGLSSLVCCCAAVGLVLNISLQRRKY